MTTKDESKYVLLQLPNGESVQVSEELCEAACTEMYRRAVDQVESKAREEARCIAEQKVITPAEIAFDLADLLPEDVFGYDTRLDGPVINVMVRGQRYTVTVALAPPAP